MIREGSGTSGENKDWSDYILCLPLKNKEFVLVTKNDSTFRFFVAFHLSSPPHNMSGFRHVFSRKNFPVQKTCGGTWI